MGKMSNWSQEVRDYLTKTYRYEKESGFVFRIYEPSKGPKQAGSVGSINRKELVLVVNINKKSYLIRVHKLAVFLETGQVYEKITHKDGNMLNNKWENLLPVGIPLSVDGSSIELSADEQVIAVEEYKQKQEALLAEVAEKKRLEKEAFEKSKAEHLATKIKEKGKEKSPPEPLVDYQATWARINAEIAKKNAEWAAHPFMQDYMKMQAKYENRLATYKHLTGICTGMDKYDMDCFGKDCSVVDGLSVSEFYEANNRTIDKKTAPKWVVDRLKVGFFEKMLEKGMISKEQVSAFLKKYTWKGDIVPNTYGELSEQDTKEYLEELRELESIHQTTYEQLEKQFKQAS
jgi:hypothetical protein